MTASRESAHARLESAVAFHEKALAAGHPHLAGGFFNMADLRTLLNQNKETRDALKPFYDAYELCWNLPWPLLGMRCEMTLEKFMRAVAALSRVID